MDLSVILSQTGIGNTISNGKYFYYIWALSKEGKKIYYTIEEDWSEDICNKAETTDFNFIYDEFKNIFDNKKDKLTDCLLPF